MIEETIVVAIFEKFVHEMTYIVTSSLVATMKAIDLVRDPPLLRCGAELDSDT